MTALCCVPSRGTTATDLVASGSADRKIMVWAPNKGNHVSPAAHIQTLHKHEGTVTALLALDTRFLSGSTDCTVRLWAPQQRGALLHPSFAQVRVLQTMPAWVTSIVSCPPGATPDLAGSIFVADSEANIARTRQGAASSGPATCDKCDALAPRCSPAAALRTCSFVHDDDHSLPCCPAARP